MKTLKNSILAILLMTFCLTSWAQDTSVRLDANITMGERNVLVGGAAGDSITSASQHDNTYVGYRAGEVTTGYRNTFIGGNSGANSTLGTYNTFVGYGAGKSTVSSNNVFIGAESGASNNLGGLNVCVGRATGKSITSAEGCTILGAYAGEFAAEPNNTLLGYVAGRAIQGQRNLLVGSQSAYQIVEGEENTMLGTWTGYEMTTGSRNTIIGTYAGQYKLSGHDNVYLGYESGKSNDGNGNVFIGPKSGMNVMGNDQLYIENSDTTTAPLIYGDFANDKVGINTNDVPEGYTFAVRGNIIAEEIRLKLYADGWPDYVFQPEYDMLTLEETEQQIEILGHLPGVPSAAEVGTDGIQIGEMNAILLEKIEELTLHMIDMNKEVKALREENQTLKTRIDSMDND